MIRYSIKLYAASVKNLRGIRWGFIDSRGRFIIKPQYELAYDFQENGLAIISLGKKIGIININGQYVVIPKYDSINQFSEGRAIIIDKQGFKVIDENGRELSSRAYNFIGDYKGERAIFSGTAADGRYLYGYLNLQGKEAIPYRYESATDFNDGRAVVKLKENSYELIDFNGEVIKTYNYAFVGQVGEGLLAFQEIAGGKYGYIDENGQVVITPQFTGALPFKEGRAVVNTAEDYGNKYGLIDKKGNFIIKPIYNDIRQLGEERVGVGKAINEANPFFGSKYAIADINGNFLTDYIYYNLTDYNNGLASVYDGDDTYFIDRAGNKVSILPVVGGRGTLSIIGDLVKAFVDNRTLYFSKNGSLIWRQNTIIPIDYEYRIREEKYKPNKDYLVYYPQILGMHNKLAEEKVNRSLKDLSQVKPIEPNIQLDYSYTGDFLVEFYKKHLLVLELYGYNFPFGAAHGMPSEIYAHIDLTTGGLYSLKDLFKPGHDYVKVLSNIIDQQIKNDPRYSYVFQDSYKGIKDDQPFFIGKDVLNIYFEPYEIAPYAAGFPTFKIPYRDIINIINTSGDFWRAFNY